MYSELKKNVSYPKTLFVLGLTTALFGFGCMLLGYVFLPFASASYAALLLFENKSRRIVSYALPVALWALNVLLNGFFSAEGVIYVVVGLLMYLFYTNKRTKNESVFWVAFSITIFLIISFILTGFSANNSVSFSALKDYYVGLYASLKKVFIEVASSLHAADKNGVLYFIFTREYSELMFHSIITVFPSLIIITALFLTGLSFKLFSMYKSRLTDELSNQMPWKFSPPKFVCYAYIAVAILNIFASGSTDVFSLSLNNICNVLMMIFAYMGLKFIYSIIKNTRGAFYSVLFIIVAFAILGVTTITILSYIGVYFILFITATPKTNN